MQLGNIFFTAMNAIAPILLMILLGFVLRKIGLLSEDFIKRGNNLVFNIFLPAMLFVNVYNINSLSLIQWDFMIYIVIMICLLFALGFLPAIFATNVAQRRGVLLQTIFRSNYAIIGIPVANILGGQAAVSVAALAAAFCIPLYNIFAVIALTVFLEDKQSNKRSLLKTLKDVFSNPLILSVAVGLLCIVIRNLQTQYFGTVVFSIKNDTPFIYAALDSIQSATTPLALIVLGAQFTFSAVRGLRKEIIVGTLCRTVVAPLLGITSAVLLAKFTRLLSIGATEYPTLIALFGSPVAVSSAIMASAMKNDGQLATQLVLWSSVVSIFTMFITICVLMYFGLLNI